MQGRDQEKFGTLTIKKTRLGDRNTKYTKNAGTSVDWKEKEGQERLNGTQKLPDQTRQQTHTENGETTTSNRSDGPLKRNSKIGFFFVRHDEIPEPEARREKRVQHRHLNRPSSRSASRAFYLLVQLAKLIQFLADVIVSQLMRSFLQRSE